jgi:hypothetical protein
MTIIAVLFSYFDLSISNLGLGISKFHLNISNFSLSISNLGLRISTLDLSISNLGLSIWNLDQPQYLKGNSITLTNKNIYWKYVMYNTYIQRWVYIQFSRRVYKITSISCLEGCRGPRLLAIHPCIFQKLGDVLYITYFQSFIHWVFLKVPFFKGFSSIQGVV